MLIKYILTLSFLFTNIFLASCASYAYKPIGDNQQDFTLQPLSQEMQSYYDYPRETVDLKNNTDPVDTDLSYTVRHLKYPSISDNGQKDNLVRGTFYKSKSKEKKPLIIILPLWGSYTYPVDETSEDLIKDGNDRHVLLFKGENFMLDWKSAGQALTPKEFDIATTKMAERFKTHVTDLRRFIDWAETQPTIDMSRIAIIGFSHSALVATVAAAVDPRIRITISVMGGTHIHQILANCSLERTDTLKKVITERFGWSKERYQQELKKNMKQLSLVKMQHRINPKNTLIIESAYDDCIPQTARDDLWKYTGYPDKFSYAYGHKTAFLSMTILGGYSLRHKIYDFLDKRL